MPANAKALEAVLTKCARASLFPDGAVAHVNQRNAFGDTPLHLVSRWGDAEGVKLLVSAGAEVNAAGEKEQSPLFVTANVEVAQALLDAGADLQHRDDDGYTPEGYLRIVGKDTIADFLKVWQTSRIRDA